MTLLETKTPTQNQNNKMAEITPLPFPLYNVTNISDMYCYHLRDDNGDIIEKKECSKYYFTIPLDKMNPSPCSFIDTTDTRTAEANRNVLLVLFHLCNKMYYGDKPRRGMLPDGQGKRYNVFMEYLLPEGIDVDDYILSNALGIRFHFHVYDDDLNFLEGIQKMIENNGGAEFSYGNNNDDGDEPAQKKRKKAPVKKKKIEFFHNYEKIKSLWDWYTICNIASNENIPQMLWTQDTLEPENWTPSVDHPFHPDEYFSWGKSLIPGMMSCQNIPGSKFGVPSAVFYINEYMRNPLAMLGVTLPKSTLWFEQDEIQARDTNMSLSSMEYMENRFMTMKLSGYVKRNNLKEIKLLQDQRLAKLYSKTDPDDIIMAMKKYRESSVQYISSTWRNGAAVSQPIQLMSKYAHEEKTWTSGAPEIVDMGMSSFGNYVATILKDFESILRISTTHTILFRVLVNSLDAYRNKYNLHNNVVLLGEGATGKSHILECVQKMLLPNTVKSITHATDKASAVDSDNNDHITCYHEMPPQMLGSEKSGQEQGSHIIKDKMTSCSVETNTIFVDSETGRRHAVNVISECIGVFIMATNERWDTIPQALSTRMIAILVNDILREGFGINDMTCDIPYIKNGTCTDSNKEAEFHKRMHKMQNVLVMVEKMIYTNVLEDVEMAVFDTMQINMTKYMIEEHIMYGNGNIREIKYLKNFARTLTIMHAVHKFINDPKSPGFNNENFGKLDSFKVLTQIQPYLFCTEEIALFSLTVNADQLIKVYHFKVVELMLYTLSGVFLRNMNKTLKVSNDYIATNAMFNDHNGIYNHITKGQKEAFGERLSRQNIIVAFRELQDRSFNGQPIIKYDALSLYINHDYIEKHFTLNSDTDRYECNFNLNTIMEDVFKKSYTNKYTVPQKRMVVGTTYNKETPFLFSTIDKETNPDHILTRQMTIAVKQDDIGENEEDEMYERHNNTIKFKVDYENLCFQTYVRKCGYEELDMYDILYDHHVEDGSKDEYPLDYYKWFKKITKK